MRVRHGLVVAAVILIAIGVKLMSSRPIRAEAHITPIPAVNVMQMQTSPRNMPVQKIRDMTFVFVDGE